LGIKMAEKLAIIKGDSETPSQDGGLLYEFSIDLARECY
jgi:hypothetical protein